MWGKWYILLLVVEGWGGKRGDAGKTQERRRKDAGKTQERSREGTEKRIGAGEEIICIFVGKID